MDILLYYLLYVYCINFFDFLLWLSLIIMKSYYLLAVSKLIYRSVESCGRSLVAVVLLLPMLQQFIFPTGAEEDLNHSHIRE